jgi:hypothetical protein
MAAADIVKHTWGQMHKSKEQAIIMNISNYIKRDIPRKI